MEKYLGKHPKVTLNDLLYPAKGKLAKGEENHHKRFVAILKSVVAEMTKQKQK